MSAYQKLKNIRALHGVDGDELREIIEIYADCLEDSEPYAVNAIAEARSTAMGITDALEDEA